jgi:hypothetical protein
MARVGNPINVGGVIRRVFILYADGAPLVLPVAAVVFLVIAIPDTLLRNAGRGYALLTLPVNAVGTALVTGMVVELVAHLEAGDGNAGVRSLLRSVEPVIGPLILVSFVAALGEGVGFVLLIVPGLFLLTIWSVFAPVIVLERPPGLDALGRSRDLVRGNGWRVFRVILVLVVLVDALGAGVGIVKPSAGTVVVIVIRVVLDTLALPLAALASAVLYFELRRTRELGEDRQVGA